MSAEAPGVLVPDDWGGVWLRTAASGTVQLTGVAAAYVFDVDLRPGSRTALLVDGFGEIYLRARGAEAVSSVLLMRWIPVR